MAAHSGPRISAIGDALFYVDSENLKSVNNSKIIDMVTNEEKQYTSIIENGYFKTDYKVIEKFTEPQLLNLDALTINVSMLHETGKTGYAFSINSEDIIGFVPDGLLISYDYISAETIGTAATSHTTIAYSPTTIISKDYTTAETIATTSTSHTTIAYSPTTIISKDYSTVETIGTAATSHTSVAYSPSTIISKDYTTAETIATTLSSFNSNTLFEMSLYADASQIILTNKSNDLISNLVYPVETQKNQYSIIYRKYSANSIPISLYVNGNFAADTGVIAGSSQFQNYGISLFNKVESNFAEYKIKSVSIYDKELNDTDIKMINRLEQIT